MSTSVIWGMQIFLVAFALNFAFHTKEPARFIALIAFGLLASIALGLTTKTLIDERIERINQGNTDRGSHKED